MVEPSADTAGWPDLALLGRVVVRAATHSTKLRVQTRGRGTGGHRRRAPDVHTRTLEATRGHRMRGYRSLDTGRADAGHTADTGRWTDAGNADADRAAKLTVASGHPGDTTPLGRRTVLLWAAPAALGEQDGLAVRPPASARDCLPHYPGSCSVAPPAAKRRPRRIALAAPTADCLFVRGVQSTIHEGSAGEGAFTRRLRNRTRE